MAASFKRAPEDRKALFQALASREILVVGLCAAWCNTCGEFFQNFEAVASDNVDATFLWLDIEDDADIAGDIDVENFPTLAIFERARPVHFGVSLPYAEHLRRLVRSIGSEAPSTSVDPAVAGLPSLVHHWAAG
jgi:thioredoxin 1